MADAMSTSDAAVRRDVHDLIVTVGRHWMWLLTWGLLTTLLGVVLLVWPGQTVLVVAAILGAYLLVSGFFEIVAALAGSGLPGGYRLLTALSGFFSVLVGIFAFRSWTHAVFILVLLIGIGFLFRGMAQLVEAIADKHTPARDWQICSGILGLVAGVLVLVYPKPSLVTLAFVAGFWLIMLGVIQVVVAFRFRSLATEAPEALAA
jgi:uncharacterized membrane protein HdeD (DUF308 family)